MNALRIVATGLFFLLASPVFSAVPGLTYSGSLSTDGQKYTAGFSAGLKVSGSPTYVNSATNTDLIQITGHITPQSSHVGKTGSLFVVARVGTQYYQKTTAGNFLPWNGLLSTLLPVQNQAALTSDVEIPIFTGKLGLTGKIDVFVGYKLTDAGFLVYSSAPTSLNFTVAPVQVACTVSDWSAWGAGPAGLQQRTRTVITAAANGGTPCPALSETRPITPLQEITPLATPMKHPVLAFTDSVLDTAIVNFAHTANREWNYGGHNVPANFSSTQGNWDYNDASFAAFLFDRPSAWFKLYLLTNNPNYREYGIRDTAYYASQIDARGYFTGTDTKYGYVTPFLWYERLTGDTQYRNIAERIYQASLTGFGNSFSASQGFWTEREAALHGEAALSWYELTGERTALDRAGAMIRQVGSIAAAHGGAPQVTFDQHEGSGGSGLTNSPWMTAIYFQFAHRYYQITGDEQVLQQVSAYFDWLDVNGLYDGRLSNTDAMFNGVTVPRYLTGPLSGDSNYYETDYQHCLDVAGLVSFAVEAKARLALSTTKASQRLAELKTCSELGFKYLTRTTSTLPKYRVSPPRMWMWWMRGRYELQ